MGRKPKASPYKIKLLFEFGFSPKEIASIVKCHTSTIYNAARRYNINIIRPRIEVLKSSPPSSMKISQDCLELLAEEGFSQSETARLCGCSRQAINSRALRSKLKFKDGRRRKYDSETGHANQHNR